MKINTNLLSKTVNVIKIIDRTLELIADKLAEVRVKGIEEVNKLEELLTVYIPTTKNSLTKLEKYEQILRDLIKG